MTATVPGVSVVMPAFNVAEFLDESIPSILNQTYADLELIVVDDGSTDGSAEIVRRYQSGDVRVRLLSLEHRGFFNIAAGVAAARAPLVARMDADDVARPDRLAVQVVWMARTGVDICGSFATAFGADATELWFPETHEGIGREFLFRCAMLDPSVVVRREVLLANPYSEQASFRDYELWTRLAATHTLANVPEPLMRYRIHERQLHTVQKEKFGADFRRYRFRHFQNLYPNRSTSEYLALARVSDNLPALNLATLEQAGEWLVELADGRSRRMRQAMRQRWQATCTLSSGLGPEVEVLRNGYLVRFGAAD